MVAQGITVQHGLMNVHGTKLVDLSLVSCSFIRSWPNLWPRSFLCSGPPANCWMAAARTPRHITCTDVPVDANKISSTRPGRPSVQSALSLPQQIPTVCDPGVAGEQFIGSFPGYPLC